MKDQVLLSENGQLVVGIPLFRMHLEEELENLKDYTISLMGRKPIAYAIDAGEYGNMFMNAEFVEKRFKLLGDL